MKKILTMFALSGMVLSTYAQSQRMVLVEEFSNASCGPCAAQNPAFNTLLGQNTTKVIALKTQVWWPGFDPMYSQNTTEVSTRVTYYAVNGVPYALVNGVEVANDCGYYAGAPACLNQTEIDAAYGSPSPFDFTLSHTFSLDYDSIYVTATVTATQAVSISNLKLHIALTEKEIDYPAAPGTNGEMVFHSVMRKMIPSDAGTAMASTWGVSDADTYTFGFPVPSYVYNYSEIAIVGYIQDNTSKAVQQAAYSEPLAVPYTDDAGALSLSNVPTLSCSTSFTPSVTIKNYSALDVLTSATINYKVDNGTPLTFAWTGSVNPGNTALVALPAITSTPGSHMLTVYTSEPNGVMDFYLMNNSVSVAFNIAPTPIAAPLNQTFQSSTFPPAGWILFDQDNDAVTWSRKTAAGGFGYSSACAKMDFFNSPPGSIDEFYMPMLDLSAATAPQYLTFSVAYAQYTNEQDVLDISVSTNCGGSWTSVYFKSGNILATASPLNTAAFTPSSSQWRGESVNLSSYVGSGNVLIRFRATSDYGNNLYVDDVNLGSSPTSIDENAVTDGVNISPNPFNDQTTIEFNLAQNENVKMEVYNVLGKLVRSVDKGNLSSGNHTIILTREDMTSGVYFVNLTIGDRLVTQKVTVK